MPSTEPSPRRPAARRVSLVAAVGLVARLADAACPAGCVGGGKSPTTDCFVEFDGMTAAVESCTDGNPSCDMDGTVNGVCTFPLSVCLNVAGDPSCTPTGLAGTPVVKPASSDVARSLAAALAGLDPTKPGCTAPGLAVPIGATLKGVGDGGARLVVTASAGRKHDRNRLALTCRPSPVSPSLARTIQPIFSAHCALPACHQSTPGGIAPALDLPDVHDAIVGVAATNVPSLQLVHPGSVVESYLARKILGKRIPDHTQRMPNGCPSQVPAGGCLDDGQIAAILAWIQTGAPDN